MYSILIVDDEKVICEGIRHRISSLGIPDIGSISVAYSGMEAIKLVREKHPDIIITDIKMPEMGGIELIETISREDTHVKFIALSGYDDYKYIRSAFKLGVIDYLLKPVNTTELEQHLKSAIKKLEDERNVDAAALNLNKEKLSMMLSQLFLSQYMHANALENLYEKLKTALSRDYFAVGLLSIKYSSEHAAHPRLIADHFEFTKQHFSFNGDLLPIFLFNNAVCPIIVFNFSVSELYEQAILFLEEYMRSLKILSYFNLAASISPMEAGVHNLKKLYSQAEKAISYKILYSSQQVIRYAYVPTDNPKLKLDKRDLDEMESAINSNSLGQFNLLIDKWFCSEFLTGQTIENIRKIYNIILKKSTDILNNYQDFPLDEQEKDFNQFYSLDEIKTYLKNYVYKLIQFISHQQKMERTVVDIAIKYLKENYMREINMAEISNMLSMNYSYFSKLFKTQTGMTFTAYLTKLRMEEAKRLLSNPTNRISEVSSQIGYEDAHNFSRAFKNHFGVSPTNYRKSL